MSLLDDLQNELDRFMNEQNSRGLEEFEWYSPSEMQMMLYNPFSSQSPVRLKTMDLNDYRRIPLLNQAQYILNRIREAGEVPLTAKGFLPTALVRDIYQQGLMKEYYLDTFKKGKMLREFDSYNINMTRLLLEVAGLTKKRKGKLSLTKRGTEIIHDHGLLFYHLLYTSTHTLNLGYFDGCGQTKIGKLGWAFSILLLSKYGHEERSSDFYAEKYFHAFPQLIDEVEMRYIRTQEETAYHCYQIRTFDHFFHHLGIIRIEKENFLARPKLLATDLLSKMFHIEEPNIKRMWN